MKSSNKGTGDCRLDPELGLYCTVMERYVMLSVGFTLLFAWWYTFCHIKINSYVSPDCALDVEEKDPDVETEQWNSAEIVISKWQQNARRKSKRRKKTSPEYPNIQNNNREVKLILILMTATAVKNSSGKKRTCFPLCCNRFYFHSLKVKMWNRNIEQPNSFYKVRMRQRPPLLYFVFQNVALTEKQV